MFTELDPDISGVPHLHRELAGHKFSDLETICTSTHRKSDTGYIYIWKHREFRTGKCQCDYWNFSSILQ